MVKLRYILVMVLVATASTPAFVGWRVVTDRNCIKVMATNTASWKLIEDQHNQRLDSIASKERKVELYLVSTATIREPYKLTTENIPGFGAEGLYCKEIGTCAFGILGDVSELINTVNKTKFKSRFTCLTGLGSLAMEIRQLVGNFVNIMNNAKMQNPLKGQGTAEKKSDGYNLLDRYKRLSLTNRIYTDLMEVRYRVEGMMLMAQFVTVNDLSFAIDLEGWASVVTVKNQIGSLIQDWNGLVMANY